MADGILSKYVIPGSRVDIREIRKKKGKEDGDETRIYQSHVYDVLSEDRIEVVMPMEKTKIILLSIGSEFDLFFYLTDSIYRCRAKVVDRDKKNSTYLLTMDLISNLRRDQRREYFRFSCALEMNSRVLEKDELQALEKNEMKEEFITRRLPLGKSVIVDISGGGMRFVADFKYELGSVLLCKYQLDTETGTKVYELFGKVLSIKEVENRHGVFEHRVQYINIDKEVREEIIRFIFGEERKNLRKKGENL
ncbi:c-di-GMP-binding flagellar brake protein YcgR [Kineothrix alysoides]|uniref:C-di-GMP-binding flagellar brake protein YcgR n=1 Tax=Kineothrix alysoides TaxID=1469948 RepID=A0A4V2QBJ0_9FIRM|nr:flagellar brake protein [Kineothrix alysoides]TCL56572.1 c-di-GMP-binding flagellar brake protein YcgR [Kineothrix alysoides]